METLEAIQKRCSLKTWISERPVEPEKVRAVLDAARLAPSARNTQPWRFVVVQGKEAVTSLVEAAFFGPTPTVKQAPLLIVVCARPEDDVVIDGKPYYLFDLGLAVENMLLAATALGLVTHPMTSFNEAVVKRMLQIPEDVRVVIITPLAYPSTASYEEAARERLSQRVRRKLDELVYYHHWSKPEID
ncbi:MAG: nitroreductase family protein [Anaerolineae bacterium]|nr:nitroreductase family protein [Anaerolineae bacterium]